MVHHGTNGRNEVGQAFLPVRLNWHPLLANRNIFQNFAYLIFHFSFVIVPKSAPHAV